MSWIMFVDTSSRSPKHANRISESDFVAYRCVCWLIWFFVLWKLNSLKTYSVSYSTHRHKAVCSSLYLAQLFTGWLAAGSKRQSKESKNQDSRNSPTPTALDTLAACAHPCKNEMWITVGSSLPTRKAVLVCGKSFFLFYFCVSLVKLRWDWESWVRTLFWRNRWWYGARFWWWWWCRAAYAEQIMLSMGLVIRRKTKLLNLFCWNSGKIRGFCFCGVFSHTLLRTGEQILHCWSNRFRKFSSTTVLPKNNPNPQHFISVWTSTV